VASLTAESDYFRLASLISWAARGASGG